MIKVKMSERGAKSIDTLDEWDGDPGEFSREYTGQANSERARLRHDTIVDIVAETSDELPLKIRRLELSGRIDYDGMNYLVTYDGVVVMKAEVRTTAVSEINEIQIYLPGEWEKIVEEKLASMDD